MTKKTEDEKERTSTRPLRPNLIAQPEVLEGKYCNAAALGHTKREFVLDFVFRVHNEAHLVARIITSPPHAKNLLEALRYNIEQYEKQFGPIAKDTDVWSDLKPTRH
jgi:hypothetical protein